MDKKPVISIFICTYNQEKYIEETLDSFFMQKCDFTFEIVIAEDCSSDSTLKICKEYRDKYRGKVNIISRSKNLGLINNFFEGITHCKGDYIAMCGGDDYWTDELKLQKQVTFLNENKDYVITYTDSIMIDENGVKISDSEVGENCLKDFSEIELQKGAFISPRTMLFRNVIDFNFTSYKGVSQEDAFLISLLGLYGKGKYLNNIKPSAYRILSNGIWSSQTEIERLFSTLPTFKVLIKKYKKLNKKEVLQYYRDLYLHNVKRSLFLSVKNGESKSVLKAYFHCLKLYKNWFNDSYLIQINKEMLAFFLTSPKK